MLLRKMHHFTKHIRTQLGSGGCQSGKKTSLPSKYKETAVKNNRFRSPHNWNASPKSNSKRRKCRQSPSNTQPKLSRHCLAVPEPSSCTSAATAKFAARPQSTFSSQIQSLLAQTAQQHLGAAPARLGAGSENGYCTTPELCRFRHYRTNSSLQRICTRTQKSSKLLLGGVLSQG